MFILALELFESERWGDFGVEEGGSEGALIYVLESEYARQDRMAELGRR